MDKRSTAPEQLQELPPVLTVPEVARVLRISRGAAYEAIRSGALPGAILIGRTIRVPKTAVARLLGVDAPGTDGGRGADGGGGR